MTKLHTPGPWFVVEAESMKYCSVVEFEYGSGARGTVGLIGTDGVTVGAPDLDEQNANARLIAAAPDLLAAATQVLNSNFAKDYRLISPFKELAEAVTKASS